MMPMRLIVLMLKPASFSDPRGAVFREKIQAIISRKTWPRSFVLETPKLDPSPKPRTLNPKPQTQTVNPKPKPKRANQP